MKVIKSHPVWIGSVVCALILAVISFTPLVIPAGQIHPTLGGVPVTLWTGILIAFTFVALTYLAGRVHPESSKFDEHDS